MKKTSKIGWIRILLVISQLVLTGFVIQWLTYQYRDARTSLIDDLYFQYVQSQQQVIDTLLVEQVVNPAMLVRHNIAADSLQRSEAVVTISIPDSAMASAIDSTNVSFHFIKKKDVLLRSMKLFIAQTSDSLPHMAGYAGIYPGNPDTALFKQVFAERLSLIKLPVAYTWISNTGETQPMQKGHTIILQDPDGGCFPAATIGRIIPLIVKKMSAQIFFSLILLLLTGTAFIITFMSLKRQLVINALRNEFVGNISHELKTPVSTVKVALEALRNPARKWDSEKTEEYLSMASQEMNRLEMLVTRVLDQSLMEENTGLALNESIPIQDLAAGVIKSMEPRAEAEGARIVSEGAGDALIIRGDRLMISSVLSNLLDNSLKYAAPAAEVYVRTYREGRKIRLAVSDNGPGIPREYHSRIFEKFFRVPGNNRHNIKGYGLGLAFARQVMHQHGGTITLKNLEKGCIFILSFPVKT